MPGRVHGDAPAALGITNRKGLGRTRHIDTDMLWIQETAAEKRLGFDKVLGLEIPAGLFTKCLGRGIPMQHRKRLRGEFKDGRADAAPKLNTILKVLFGYDFMGEEFVKMMAMESYHVPSKLRLGRYVIKSAGGVPSMQLWGSGSSSPTHSKVARWIRLGAAQG